MSVTTAVKLVTPSFNTRAGFASQRLNVLLAQLPPDFAADPLMTDGEIESATNAANEAASLNHSLLTGLEAIGGVLSIAGTTDANSVQSCDLAAIGSLIAHLSAEAQFLQETEEELRHIVAEHHKAISDNSCPSTL